MRYVWQKKVLVPFGIALLLCGILWQQADATPGKKKAANYRIKGVVTDSHDRPLVGATVYLIDSSLVNTTSSMTHAAITAGTTESYDEPLEDIVNDAAKAKTLPQAKTNKTGKFSIRKVDANAKFFAFVVPSDTDVDHLPGGDATRIAFSPKGIDSKEGLHIRMSWKVPEDATYIGTSACYECHGPGSKADVTTNKHHGHALMFHKPGQDTDNQDAASHVGSNWNELASKFTLATAYNKPVAPNTAVTYLSFTDYNADAATNNGNTFAIYENSGSTRIDPATGKTYQTWVKGYLWKTDAGKYYITLENVITPSDPNNLVTMSVPLLMGGYIRQRILLGDVPAPAGMAVSKLKGLYTFITYQAISGSASRGQADGYDRSRRAWVIGGGGGGGFTTFIDTKTKKLKFPTVFTGTGSVHSITCAVCHVGYGSQTDFVDGVTGEELGHTVNDVNGVFDLGADGHSQDMGINCEQCHGPGSKHREETMKIITASASELKTKKGESTDRTGKYIVNPKLLGADRASLICGRCHNARGIISSDDVPVGISRSELIAKYVAADHKSMAADQLYSNGEYAKGGHEGFTYSDWLTSKHSRNSRQLVGCDDCHDAMGDSQYRYGLKGDPDDGTHGLCLNCHAIDITTHVPEKTGSAMKGTSMACINCHMPRVGKGGAGRPGLLLGTPTGLSSDANITYWENDQSSHVFTVPNKFTRGVAGVSPASAMPAPYTNACGTCHDASKLQFQQGN